MRNRSGYLLDRMPGELRRFFWRVNYRYGREWWKMPPTQVAKELRMKSHRRAL